MVKKISIDDIIQAATEAFTGALEMSCGGPDDDCGDRLVYEVIDVAVFQFTQKLEAMRGGK